MAGRWWEAGFSLLDWEVRHEQSGKGKTHHVVLDESLRHQYELYEVLEGAGYI